MDKTLLVLGDESDWDSYKKFCGQLKHRYPKNLSSITATYEQLAENRLPNILKLSLIFLTTF